MHASGKHSGVFDRNISIYFYMRARSTSKTLQDSKQPEEEGSHTFSWQDNHPCSLLIWRMELKNLYHLYSFHWIPTLKPSVRLNYSKNITYLNGSKANWDNVSKSAIYWLASLRNKTKHFRLRRYNTVWLLSDYSLFVPSLCSLSALEVNLCQKGEDWEVQTS